MHNYFIFNIVNSEHFQLKNSKMKRIILQLGLILFISSHAFAQNDETWIDLDGVDDYLDFGTDSVLAGKNQFTVEMKIHFDNINGDYTIIGQRTADFNRTIVMQRWAGDLYIFISNGNYGNCAFIPCTETFYHLAIVYDGTGLTNSDRLKFYINGSLQTLTFTGTIDTASYVTSPAANLVLGCEHNGPSTQLQFLDGQFGELCIWDYPLTAAEVLSRVNPEVNGSEAGLVEYFHFNNGISGGNNTAITSFPGGHAISTIRPMNLTMNGAASNFIGRPLPLNTIDTSLSVNGTTLTSNALTATWQWLDCNNGYAVIPGETSQSYTATTSGNYAVQISQGACSDTSACQQVVIAGILPVQQLNLNIYPNPVTDQLIIECKGLTEKLHFEILNSTGEKVYKGEMSERAIVPTARLSAGIYLLKVVSESGIFIKRITRE
jgi:hypothetical protein